MLYARLTVIHGDPQRTDSMPEPREQLLTRAGEMPGLHALYCLVDRASGRAAAISIWESQEAMSASDTLAFDQFEQALSASGGTVISVDRMEVVNAIHRRSAS